MNAENGFWDPKKMTSAPLASNCIPRTFLLAGLALLLSLVSPVFAQEETSKPPEADAPTPDATSSDRALRPGFPLRMSGRQGLARRWRNPSPADIELFMIVAGDLNPAWRNSLTELQVRDPEAFTQAITTNGRRLWQLVSLREQKPALYDLRIEEIRVREKLSALGREYQVALAEGWSAELVSVLFLKIKEMATKQIDIQMRVRGEELAAMAEALEQLRNELLVEATDRVARTQQLVEEITAPPSDTESGSSLRPASDTGAGEGGATGADGAGDATTNASGAPLG